MHGWIGVDLDGTLAEYHGWKGEDHIGEIIGDMKVRICGWLAKGIPVKIFTARANGGPAQIETIHGWLERNGLPRLEVTATKDFGMIELWDDRCVQIIENTGKRADGGV